MKQIRHVIFLQILFLFSLFSCSHEEPHIQAVDIVMNKFEKSLKQNVFVFASGGAMLNDIKKLKYSLHLCENVLIDESRRLLIDNIESLLSIVNNDQKVRKYLHYYPFSEKNIYLTLSFLKNNKCDEDVDPPFISFVQNQNEENMIYYYRKDNTEKPFYSETYAEAYEKVYGIPLPDRMSQIKDLLEKSN